jgi:hypothetical protein
MDCLPEPQAGAVRGTAVKVTRCTIQAYSGLATPTIIEAPLDATFCGADRSISSTVMVLRVLACTLLLEADGFRLGLRANISASLPGTTPLLVDLRRPPSLGFVLGSRLHAHHNERASGRASWASNCSFVDNYDAAPTRTTVPDHKHLVLVALPSACCRHAVETYDPNHVFRSARRAGRTFWSLRARRSWWASRSRRTRVAFLTRRPDRTRLALWPARALPTTCYAKGKQNCDRDAFHMHARTSAFCIQAARRR